MHTELLKIPDWSTMGTLFFLLKQMYDDVLVDAPLAKDNHECADLLEPYVSSHLSGKNKESCLLSPKSDIQNSSVLDSLAFKIDGKPITSENESHSRYHTGEITLLQLTLIKMILDKVQNQDVAIGVKQKYLQIVTILKEARIDSKLIHFVCSSDKQLSHLASKSLVSLVCFQLNEERLLNSDWLAFCSEALLGFPSSNRISKCLWTLTNMIKEILKNEGLRKEGNLKKLLMPLDEILNGFYNSIMFYYSDIPQDIPISAKATNDLSSFLDLLELLVASRIQMPLNLSCQRMLFLNGSCVLGLATAPVHDLIKKKSIILLKKCILHKTGEDLMKRKTHPSSHQDSYINTDTSVLAGAVLQFVKSGWLDRLSVSEMASHFGGSQVKPEPYICSSANQVTLRALSLVLLKALEIKVKDSVSEAQDHLESVMCLLMMFLKRYLRPSPCVHPLEHPCTWVSVLFIDQDDDLFEASNALLTVHLKFERFQREVGFTMCHLDCGTLDAWTHQNGCNPHCIFLFLLKSVAFDATVLLDFLISSETCFLEYFVRYLKLLVENWSQFVKVSKLPRSIASRDYSFLLSSQEKDTYHLNSNWQNASCDPQSCTVMLLTSSQNFSSSWHVDSQSVKPTRAKLLHKSDNTSSLGPLQRLVDYESSEDSEEECVGEQYLTETKQPSLNNQTCSGETNFMEVDNQAATSKQNVLPLDHKNMNISSVSCCQIFPNTTGSAEEMLQKSMNCFQELQELISKLHRRNLFPYNPSALLKLLTQVLTISKAHNSAAKQSESMDMQCQCPNLSPPTC